MRLKGKVAIVTGGGSAVGAGLVRTFVAEGAQVVIADADLQAGLDLAAACGPAARAVRVDVTDRAAVRLMMETAELHFGRIDVVVNMAGAGHQAQPLEVVEESDFDHITAVNMKAVYLSMREVVPRMKGNAPGAHGIRGVVLNITGTGGTGPGLHRAWASASEGWVSAATRAQAAELAPAGIRVVALLCPMAIETPLGRSPTPEDVGNSAAFLCSDDASMITGACLAVDGGRCI